ncbi:MAG: hypothetical protein NTZ09_16440 [Candidatus Hydrogenedentes bacterium]|nr:hypothetical protein [Candidatus Hydrogenedentota bacterium]
MRKLLPKLCGEPLLDGRPELYVLAEPTVNQVAWGGFEGDLNGLQLRPGAEIVEGPEALNGKSLRISSDDPQKVVPVRLPVVMDEAGNPAGELKDGETYTLSLDMKWEDAAPKGSNFRLCVMGLVGRQPDEMGLWKELTYAQGSRYWRHYVYRIVPGETYPAGTRDILVAVGIVHGTGTLWVDNVQLEHKLYATPFVQGIRKPWQEKIISNLKSQIESGTQELRKQQAACLPIFPDLLSSRFPCVREMVATPWAENRYQI